MYVQKLKSFVKMLSDKNIHGVAKQLHFSMFNDGFIHRKTSFNPNSGFLCLYTTDTAYTQTRYWQDIVDFCLSTDVCERLHMSIRDIMNLDLWTFEYIRDKIKSTPRQETDALKDIMRKLEVRGAHGSSI